MVDTISIEIFRHFGKTGFPPCIPVFCHLCPIIGRKSPILPRSGKIIGWSTCLRIEIEQGRSHPRISTVSTHPDRYIAFQYDAFASGIPAHTQQLFMQVILLKIVSRNNRISNTFLIGKTRYFPFIIFGILSPFRKYGRM